MYAKERELTGMLLKSRVCELCSLYSIHIYIYDRICRDGERASEKRKERELTGMLLKSVSGVAF